jgi:transposase
MIQITPQMRIFLAVDPVDFRKGIDGLAALCKHLFQSDPFSGHMFVFLNRRRNAIKVLVYDGQGFWLCQKRLSKGCFKWWPKTIGEKMPGLDAWQLQMLIWNGNPDSGEIMPMWKKI